MKKIFDKAFVLYCIVGVLNFIVCTAIMFLLYNLGVCSEDVAPLVNYGLGGVIWYVANLKLVFPGQKQTPALVFRFVLEAVCCYLLCYYLIAPPLYRLLADKAVFQRIISFIMHLPEEQLEANCVMALGSLCYAVLNYFGQRFFVFHEFKRAKKTAQQRETDSLDPEQTVKL